MKHFLSILLILSLALDTFGMLSLEMNEGELKGLLRNVTEANDEQNVEKLGSTITKEFQLIWIAYDGAVLKTERVKREDYLKHIESFWADTERYTYTNKLISSARTEDGYTIGLITKQTYVYRGVPVVKEEYQKVRVVKVNGSLRASVVEMHQNPHRLNVIEEPRGGTSFETEKELKKMTWEELPVGG